MHGGATQQDAEMHDVAMRDSATAAAAPAAKPAQQPPAQAPAAATPAGGGLGMSPAEWLKQNKKKRTISVGGVTLSTAKPDAAKQPDKPVPPQQSQPAPAPDEPEQFTGRNTKVCPFGSHLQSQQSAPSGARLQSSVVVGCGGLAVSACVRVATGATTNGTRHGGAQLVL